MTGPRLFNSCFVGYQLGRALLTRWSQWWFPCGLAVAFVVALLGGCSKPKHGSPADGAVLGSTYSNSYFNLTVDIPPGWCVGELKPLMLPGSSGAAGKTNAAEVHSFQLLMVSDKPLNMAADSNASLLVMAEKASTVPGVKDARDYIARISQLMVDAPIAYRPTTAISEIPLGNFRAQRLEFIAQLTPTKTARQTYLATLREGYIISFILSAADEGGIRRAEQMSHSARFR